MNAKTPDDKNQNQKTRLVIVTGVSGAGRSIAINALEDIGFYCIDNLPIAMLEPAVRYFLSQSRKACAVGMDIRDPQFTRDFVKIRQQISSLAEVDVVFITADEDAIASRFISTRRKHPLLDGGGELLTAILREKALMSGVERSADAIFDTSAWSPHVLAREIERRYGGETTRRNLHCAITSFGFRYGQLRPADTIFDVRFIENPHFVKELKDKTGLSSGVSQFVLNDPKAQTFLDKLVDIHRFLLPNYLAEGKNYFRIGIGCTGGKHRSVSIAEELALRLAKINIPQVVISVSHRDVQTVNPINELAD